MSAGVRIAAWSGPRNISTALMRAWGSRADTAVVDEPLYAVYLQRTGIDHPMAAEVVAAGETDLDAVVSALTGPVPDGRAISYQKHMAHHLLPGMELGWIGALRSFLLIRDPDEVLRSYAQRRGVVTPEDTGLPQQVQLFERLTEHEGAPPVVVDARDVLHDPAALLAALCAALEVPYDPAMLSWAPGPRPTDGVWAPAWYDRVWRSTGFEPYRPSTGALPPAFARVAGACRPLYELLHRHRLVPDQEEHRCTSSTTSATVTSSSTSRGACATVTRRG